MADEGEGGDEDLVPRPDAQQQQRQVEGRRPAGERRGVRHAARLSPNSRSKASTCGPERGDPVGVERVEQQFPLGRPHVRRREVDAASISRGRHSRCHPSSRVLMTFAGTPTAVQLSGMFFVTTAPAPTIGPPADPDPRDDPGPDPEERSFPDSDVAAQGASRGDVAKSPIRQS